MSLLIEETELTKTISFEKLFVLAAPYYPLEGMNEHGVAISLLTATDSEYPNKDGQTTISDTALIRLVLDKAKSFEDSINIIKGYNLFGLPGYPNHYMIADASGKSAVIEYINGEMTVIYGADDYQIVTNFLLYNNEELYGFGSDRYNNIDEKLKETEGILTEYEALELLEKNTIAGDEQWSVVFNLTQKKMFVSFYDEYDKVYEFEID